MSPDTLSLALGILYAVVAGLLIYLAAIKSEVERLTERIKRLETIGTTRQSPSDVGSSPFDKMFLSPSTPRDRLSA